MHHQLVFSCFINHLKARYSTVTPLQTVAKWKSSHFMWTSSWDCCSSLKPTWKLLCCNQVREWTEYINTYCFMSFIMCILKALFGNAKNQIANATVITQGHFSESGEMSCILQKSHQLLLHYWAQTHCRFGFDVETAVLHSQEKSALKTGPKICERKRRSGHNPMGNRLHLITMHEYECCSACPWKIPQFKVTCWGRENDVNIFCSSSRTWQLFKGLSPERMTSMRQIHEWHIFKFYSVQWKQQEKLKKEKRWEEKGWCTASQCQVRDYRWLALCRGAWACFQAYFSVIFFLYPWARSLWRVRMTHGALCWMELGHAGRKKTCRGSWKGERERKWERERKRERERERDHMYVKNTVSAP